MKLKHILEGYMTNSRNRAAEWRGMSKEERMKLVTPRAAQHKKTPEEMYQYYDKLYSVKKKV